MNSQVSIRSKVYVGLSGGVDSSVSAALLKEQGYNVTGVFIKTWTPEWLDCTWKEERLDAMRVCAKLDIPFITLDLSKEYKKEVVDYMIAEYKAGRTPNPDVMCNRYVKFGGFYNWAMKNGAPACRQAGTFVSTGHYARIGYRVQGLGFSQKRKKEKNYTLYPKPYTLLAGSDPQKDQSYFLWTLTKDQLAHTLFPVGGMLKPEVRKLAKKFGLPTAEKKDSQGLCFMGKIDVKDFLSHYIKPKRGKVLDENGKEIGWHNGATFLTIGERHNFTITEKTPNDAPYFVMAKNVKKNTITVSYNPCRSVEGNSRTVFEIKDVNWISGVPEVTTPLLARLRYRQPLQKVRITNYESLLRPEASEGQARFKIKFEEAQSGGAAGQSIVLYDKDVCLGGGIIV